MVQVLLKETVDRVVIAEARPALSIVLNPVKTCVLELRWNALLYQIGVNIFDKSAW
jgi:hypothetical protein